jgi:UDP-N-acetylmuramate: L-alanyl-gamma-D-glutamyl-meso-diaminopimelate ligase
VFCHAGGLGWDPREALAPLGEVALVCGSIEALVASVKAHARAGDHVLCMSNGGFGGIHTKLLGALGAAP